MDDAEIKSKLKHYICAELIGRSSYVLADDEPLISRGLIDSFSVARLGVFIEEAFGVHVLDTDLTTEAVDTVDLIVAMIRLARS